MGVFAQMNEVKLLIGGADVDAKSARTFERKSPITGEVVVRAAAAGAEDARAAVDAAAAAFPAWAALGPNARRKFLLDAAAKLRASGPEFSRLGVEETGAIPGWGHFNTAFAATLLEEAAALTTQVIGETVPSDQPGTLALALRQPAGVVVGMAPWNAPVILGVRAIAVPLAVGNTVVLKASELSPATHRLIVDAFVAAGLPAGVVNFISHAAADAPAVVEALISHPATKRVNFTGSSRVGRIIGELSGKYLKPCLLELGGKAPLVILDDAELDEAVAAAAFGAFMHQGQICMSTERIIVVDKIYDAFMKKFIAKVKSLPVGDPTKGNFPIGACVDTKTVDHVQELIKDATGKGAKVATGGKGSGGAFFEPTVVEGVKKGMRIYGEESFGPIVGGDPREGHGRCRSPRQRLRVRVVGGGVQPGHQHRAGGRPAHRLRHLSHQQPDRAGRGADALRRHQGQRPRPLRRRGRHRRVHRPALDQHRDRAPALSHLIVKRGRRASGRVQQADC